MAEKTIQPIQLADTATGTTPRYKWELLALLWFAFFLNQADRQVFPVVLPLIKKDLGLTDGQLGLIASVFVWTYGLLVPVAGFAGDRWPKKYIIGGCLLFWSCATLTTGLCSTLLQFIIVRGMATGGGEAFYAPSANALLSEHHLRNRSTALAIHQTAVYAGIILSGLIAGYIGQHYGWRNAFYVFGSAGLLLVMLIALRLQKDKSPRRTEKTDIAQTAKVIFRKPSFILHSAAFACMVFANIGYTTWMPSFLVENFKLSITDAGFSSMFYHHIGAFAGVLIGGKLADWLVKKNRRNRMLLQCFGLLAAAPFIYGMATGSTLTVVYTCLFLFGVFRGVYDSNIFAGLYEVVKPGMRSTASGLMLMFAFLVGAFAPLILGTLKPTLGLSIGLAWLSASHVVGAVLLIIGAYFFFNKDKE